MYPDRDTLSPDRDTLSNVPCSGYISACGQSIMDSGMREGGKNNASFKLKRNDFSSYPRRETAASGGKRCR